MMTVSGGTGKSKNGLRDFFGRRKSTYGLILPEEMENEVQRTPVCRRNRRSSRNMKDCFIPSDLEKWELPQYDSLFNRLVTQEGSFRKRLSSTISYEDESTKGDGDDSSTNGDSSAGGPFKAVQKWFKEIVKSLTHHSGGYDLGGDEAVEGIPVEICEKLRYVHIYL